MGFDHTFLYILGLFLFFTILLMTRVSFNYWRLKKLCSKLPTYKGVSVFNYFKWMKYIVSFGRIPPSVYVLQIISGVCTFFDEGFFLVWIFIFPHVFIYKANIIQALINNSAAMDKPFEYDVAKFCFGNGLVTSGGETWKNHRKLLSPAFHLDILKGYISIFNEHALILVKVLQQVTKNPWIEITPFLKACSFDIILDAATGLKTKCQEGKKEGNVFMENVDELMELIAYRAARPWTHIDCIFNLFPNGRKLKKNLKNVRNISRKIIKEMKETYLLKTESVREVVPDGERKCRKTFSEILLEAHFNDVHFSSEDIENEIHTFIIAGYDTISTALNYILYLVGLDKTVQENIIKELETIFQSDRKRMVTLHDLNNMKYLECVIKETMRIYPPAALFARKLNEDVEVGHYIIPKGCNLVFHLYMLHRDPEVFPNPEKFDPGRFWGEGNLKKNPFVFLPFSAGSRNCIGQKFAMLEMKTLLAHILRNYTIESLDPRDKVMFSWHVMLKNITPIRLRIIPRQS